MNNKFASILIGGAALAAASCRPPCGRTSASSSPSEAIDRNAGQMRRSATRSSSSAARMQEVESNQAAQGHAEAAGFPGRSRGAGMPTNLWAEWGSGRPKIAIVTESTRCRAARRAVLLDHTPLVPGRAATWKVTTPMRRRLGGGPSRFKQRWQRFNIPVTVAISFGPAEEQIASRPFIVRAG